jgi:hypothetical protein
MTPFSWRARLIDISTAGRGFGGGDGRGLFKGFYSRLWHDQKLKVAVAGRVAGD